MRSVSSKKHSSHCYERRIELVAEGERRYEFVRRVSQATVRAHGMCGAVNVVSGNPVSLLAAISGQFDKPWFSALQPMLYHPLTFVELSAG